MDKEKTFLYVIITLIILLLCATISTGVYKNKYDKLVSENRTMFELARARSEQYENIYRSAKNTNRELGECLSKSTTNIYELRSLIAEVRKHYEAMENIFNSIGDNNSSAWDNDSSRTSDIAE